MGQSKFSDSFISDKLKAQNYNIMDPISAVIHRDQFLMSSYGALLCFSRTFSEKCDTLVTKLGQNYGTKAQLQTFDDQGQYFYNVYTPLNRNTFSYALLLVLVLLLFSYNCGFLLLNFTCLGMLPKALGQNTYNASNIITETPIVSAMQKNCNGSAFLHLTLFVVLTNVKQSYFMKHLPEMCNI